MAIVYVTENFQTAGLTPTTGHISFGPVGRGAGCTLTGGAYVNNAGSILMPSSGDTAVLVPQYPIRCIKSLVASLPVIFADVDGGLANTHVISAPGKPTGGTFTITVSDVTGSKIGTTAPIQYNATAAAINAAIIASSSRLTNRISGTGIATGITVTFTGAFASKPVYLSVDGGSLVGGVEPGVAYAYGKIRQAIKGENFSKNGLSCLFSVKPYSFDSWPDYQDLTPSAIGNALTGLYGYNGHDGLAIKIKLVANRGNPFNSVTQVSFLTQVDIATWEPDFIQDTAIKAEASLGSGVSTAVTASTGGALSSQGTQWNGQTINGNVSVSLSNSQSINSQQSIAPGVSIPVQTVIKQEQQINTIQSVNFIF